MEAWPRLPGLLGSWRRKPWTPLQKLPGRREEPGSVCAGTAVHFCAFPELERLDGLQGQAGDGDSGGRTWAWSGHRGPTGLGPAPPILASVSLPVRPRVWIGYAQARPPRERRCWGVSLVVELTATCHLGPETAGSGFPLVGTPGLPEPGPRAQTRTQGQSRSHRAAFCPLPGPWGSCVILGKSVCLSGLWSPQLSERQKRIGGCQVSLRAPEQGCSG